MSTSIVVAPDKFKGSLSAAEVANTIAAAYIRNVPWASVSTMPIADGGEGTVALAIDAGFEPVVVSVSGPLGEPVEATYARRGDEAVVEMSSAAGLELLGSDPSPHTAATATTFGVGELLGSVIDGGVSRITLGLGGSATTDGGAGLAMGLGAELLDSSGHTIGFGGAALSELASADLSAMAERLEGIELVIANDVDNPLLGEDGSAAVYGPQKGADAAMVDALDVALARWADVLETATGTNVRSVPGVGAAGGLSAPLVAAECATLRSGAETVLAFTGNEPRVAAADLVVVGEGSLDEQSLRGKGPVAVARLAARHGADVVAVVGRCALSDAQLADAGIGKVVALADHASSEHEAIANALAILHDVADGLARSYLVSEPSR